MPVDELGSKDLHEDIIIFNRQKTLSSSATRLYSGARILSARGYRVSSARGPPELETGRIAQVGL